MKRFVKISSVAALALALANFGTMQAHAGGWAVAGGVLGGLAVGTVVGASVASAATPVYYSYPAPVYTTPMYYAPAPAATVVAVAPAPAYYYAPRVVYTGAYRYGYGYPYGRVGFGWGPRCYYGGRDYHRR